MAIDGEKPSTSPVKKRGYRSGEGRMLTGLDRGRFERWTSTLVTAEIAQMGSGPGRAQLLSFRNLCELVLLRAAANVLLVPALAQLLHHLREVGAWEVLADPKQRARYEIVWIQIHVPTEDSTVPDPYQLKLVPTLMNAKQAARRLESDPSAFFINLLSIVRVLEAKTGD